MISVEKLSKFFGAVQAVREVSFEVRKGEVVGFLGPNGAGKTTTLRIVAGFLGASRGRVSIDGYDIVEHPIEARRRIGYMPENVPLYPELRVREYLMFRAQLKRVARPARAHAVASAMRNVRIEDHAQVLIRALSKGYRQRVGFADALVSCPPVLVLDEPTSGLDPNQIREMRELIRALAVDRTVLLSTHILSEVEATCDRALVIDRGRLVAQGTLEDLSRLRETLSTRFVLRGERETALQLFKDLPATDKVKPRVLAATDSAAARAPDMFAVEVTWKRGEDAGTAVEHATAQLIRAGFLVREVSPHRATLEEVFALLTEDEHANETESRTEKEAAS